MNDQQSYEPLHLKYRPKMLIEIVGNRTTVKSLESVLAKPAKPHAYLLTGPSGCGKTTLARIIAAQLKCSARDFHEYNSSNYRGIDAVRELIAASAHKPWDGAVSVYLLDEVHQLTVDAQNAILKLLEEPPKHAYFVLATTDPEKLKDTIKTRCAHFAVQSLPRNTILDRLVKVCDAEGCPQTHPTDKVLQEIARLCSGSLRQALVMLDQVIDIKDESIALDAVLEATSNEFQTVELCKALLKGLRWQYIQEVLKGIDADVETVRHAVLGYLNAVVLNSQPEAAPKIVNLISHFIPSMMYSGKAGLTFACYMACGGKAKSLSE